MHRPLLRMLSLHHRNTVPVLQLPSFLMRVIADTAVSGGYSSAGGYLLIISMILIETRRMFRTES
jgi:hypothetical protein